MVLRDKNKTACLVMNIKDSEDTLNELIHQVWKYEDEMLLILLRKLYAGNEELIAKQLTEVKIPKIPSKLTQEELLHLLQCLSQIFNEQEWQIILSSLSSENSKN